MDDLLKFVREGLAERKGKWPAIAKEAEVSYSWLSKLGAGTYDNLPRGPSHQAIARVAEVLRRQ